MSKFDELTIIDDGGLGHRIRLLGSRHGAAGLEISPAGSLVAIDVILYHREQLQRTLAFLHRHVL